MKNVGKWIFLIVLVVLALNYLDWEAILTDSGNISLPSVQRFTILDQEVELNEDSYLKIEFTLSSTENVQIEFENLTSNELEILIIDEEYFDEYQNYQAFRGHFVKIPGMYESEESFTLGPGTYYVIIDNTDVGNVIPPWNFTDDKVICDVKVYYE